MMKLRFEQFNNDELYIIKRAFIEATKYIYQEDAIRYNDAELKMIDDILAKIIDNIKARETKDDHSRITGEIQRQIG